MEHYTDLAFRYIRMKRGRSLITVFGVSVSVMLLYIILNLGWSYLLNDRAWVREQKDYEIVLLTQDQGLIEEILKEKHVKSATVGEYYEYDYDEPVTWPNATYINTTNPYRMEKILAELTEKYGVEGMLNRDLAPDYLQGEGYEFMYIGILVYLLVSYIFAIFGVGLIKNSIQLTMFEQVKDFGNLRCIGSTVKQMERIIFLQGAVMEAAGIVAGVLFGWGGSVIAGYLIGWENTGFHALPILFIVAAFLFDLYFTMKENAKTVTGMSPVSAIRGEYRVHLERKHRALRAGKRRNCTVLRKDAGEKEFRRQEAVWQNDAELKEYSQQGVVLQNDVRTEKEGRQGIASPEGVGNQSAGKRVKYGRGKRFRRRRTGLFGRFFGKVFGVEGDYAYKNLMRSPGRFFKVVTAMTLGVAAAMILSCGALTLLRYDRKIKDWYGYYPIYVSWPVGAENNWADAVSRVPFTKLNQEIQQLDTVTDAKRILSDEVFVADYESDLHSHFTEEFIGDYSVDQFREEFQSRLKEMEADRAKSDGEALIRSALIHQEMVYVTGLDKWDLERCKKELAEGTLDVGEDGIIVVEQAYIRDPGYEDEDGLYREDENSIRLEKVVNYRLGDTIRLVDMQEYRKRLTDLTADVRETYRKNREELDRLYASQDGAVTQWEEEDQKKEEELTKAVKEYNRVFRITQAEVLEQLRAEGCYKTYTVEGILKHNPNGLASEGGLPQFIVPASHFHQAMGREEEFFAGMMYHFEPFSLRQYEKVDWNGIEENLPDDSVNFEYAGYNMSMYPVWEYEKRSMRNGLLAVSLLALFLVSMVLLNYINNTASGIYMRRREFAQLRVIGVSKRRLFKMVMLEGVAAAILSGVLGILLGAGISYGLITWIVRVFGNLEFVFPWIPGFAAVAVSVLILCGAVYFPLKKMGNDLAADLMLSGE